MTDPAPQGINIPGPVVGLLRRHDLLRSLVKRQVVAEAVGAVVVSADEQQQLLNAYRQRNRLQEDGALQRPPAAAWFGPGRLDLAAGTAAAHQRHSQELFGPKAEQRFLERKNSLDQVVYSLLRLKDGFLARELTCKFWRGERFRCIGSAVRGGAGADHPRRVGTSSTHPSPPSPGGTAPQNAPGH